MRFLAVELLNRYRLNPFHLLGEPLSDELAKRSLISVVVPCYNEEEVLHQTHSRLTQVLGSMDADYEIVYVNDGSRDQTLFLLKELQSQDPHVRVVSFSRNFGHQLAVTAGVDAASGDAVVLIDADLQDPPELIPQMVAKWREGYHVVYGVRTSRPGESHFKLVTAKMFYRMINVISDVAIPLDTGDFRLMDRRVVEVLRDMPERDRFVRGMVSWVGFKQFALPYSRAERAAGESKYPLRKMILFALDGVLSFSLVPLRMAIFLGFITAALSMVGVLYALFIKLFMGTPVPGWTFIIISVFLLSGVTLVSLGIVGEYVGRIYRESKRRPLYIIGEKHGFPLGTERQALDTTSLE
jgi:polyisoprenyl-phosphate glycosyltransferase